MKTKNLLTIAALSLMLISFAEKSFSQATTVSPANFSFTAATDYIGWSTVNNLNFKTGGLQQMTLQTNGHFGIGLTPGVDILDIGPAIPYTGYGINGQTVLQNQGNCISVGVGA